jgi:hypothetical protein
MVDGIRHDRGRCFSVIVDDWGWRAGDFLTGIG